MPQDLKDEGAQSPMEKEEKPVAVPPSAPDPVVAPHAVIRVHSASIKVKVITNGQVGT